MPVYIVDTACQRGWTVKLLVEYCMMMMMIINLLTFDNDVLTFMERYSLSAK